MDSWGFLFWTVLQSTHLKCWLSQDPWLSRGKRNSKWKLSFLSNQYLFFLDIVLARQTQMFHLIQLSGFRWFAVWDILIKGVPFSVIKPDIISSKAQATFHLANLAVLFLAQGRNGTASILAPALISWPCSLKFWRRAQSSPGWLWMTARTKSH